MALFRRLHALFSRKRLAREHEEELAFHLAMREQLHLEEGMPLADAHREARLRFGNPALWRERTYEVDVMAFPQTVLQDLHYGSRMLWRNARYTLVSILALSIGIAINTAVFTAYKAMIARSIDARDASRVVSLAQVRHSDYTDSLFSYPDYKAYQDHVRSFSGLIAITRGYDSVTLTGAGGTVGQKNAATDSLFGRLGMLPPSVTANNAELASISMVSENYFSVLEVAASRGRTFDQESARELTAAPAVVVSDAYWHRRFNGNPSILGKIIRLNNAAFAIMGVAPPNFVGTGIAEPDFWFPLSLLPLIHPGDHSLRDRESRNCRIFGRIAPGVSLAQAQAETTLFAGHLTALHDPNSELRKPVPIQLFPGSPFPGRKLSAELKLSITLVMAAAGMVLVIACANVASLQLARMAARQDELGMRLSLGASRMRLIRQLLTESALLGVAAGASAFLVTWVLLIVAATVAKNALPVDMGAYIVNVSPDLEIFAYVFALSLIAGILFGLTPALESSRSALSSAARSNDATSPGRSRRLRGWLIGSQVAVSLVLMIAGSMLVHSSMRALQMNTGYEARHVVDLNFQFPEGGSYSAEQELVTVQELQRRIMALPGVTQIASGTPPDGVLLRTAAVSLNGEKPGTGSTSAYLHYRYIQPYYFETVGIPLLFGRNFLRQTAQPEPSVVLSESAARQLWPGQDPIGKQLRMSTEKQFYTSDDILPDGPLYRVIGVAGETRGILLDGSDSHLIYLPMPEDRTPGYPLLIRTRTDPQALMYAVSEVVSSVDPNLMVSTATLEQMLRQSEIFFAASFSAAIAGTIGLLGLVLAVMGIYSTVSYLVVLRTREVGIRMALGAKQRDILSLMLSESVRPVLCGLLAGLLLAVAASHLLRRVLYGVQTIDGISFAGVSLLFLAIAFLAAYVPSRRALKVQPTVALRSY
jgi:putative ABC transport system permease protein